MTNAELIAALRCDGECNKPNCPYSMDDRDWCDEYRIIKDAADALEAAEAQLPKEGEWIWDSDTGTYHCSECNATSPQEDQDGEYIDCPNYCHNCGARMRGEQHED